MRHCLLVLALTAVASAANVQVGRPAPPIAISQVLQAPAGTNATWEGLKGNAVVLEFWATWCGGCVEQIPHLNKLAEQFQGKPVRFISLTDEEPELIHRFLKDHPMSGWVGIDDKNATFTKYEVNGRPQTILVDAAGVVRGIGSPTDLTGETMENFLAGKPIVFNHELPPERLQNLPNSLFETMIRPAGPVSVTHYSPGAVSGKRGLRWEGWGLSLRTLLTYSYDVPDKRIEAPDWAARDRYDVALADPELTPERQTQLLRQTVENTFRLKARKESRETAVYVLRRIEGTEPRLRPAASDATSHWGRQGDFTAVALLPSSIASLAEQALGPAVIDETGLKGRFDFELKWDVKDPKSLTEAVRAQLGLELVEARRPLDYLVVEAAVQPRPW